MLRQRKKISAKAAPNLQNSSPPSSQTNEKRAKPDGGLPDANMRIPKKRKLLTPVGYSKTRVSKPVADSTNDLIKNFSGVSHEFFFEVMASFNLFVLP